MDKKTHLLIITRFDHNYIIYEPHFYFCAIFMLILPRLHYQLFPCDYVSIIFLTDFLE